MKRYFLSKIQHQKYLLAVGDVFIIFLSLFIAYIINFSFFSRRSYSISLIFERVIPWGTLLVFLYIFIFYIADLYTGNKIKNLFFSIVTISLSVLIVSLINSGILFFFTKYVIGRKVIIINIPVVIGLLILWRFISINIILKKGKPCRLALIGRNQIISNFIEEFSQLKLSGFEITQIYLTGSNYANNTLLPESITIYKSIDALLENLAFDTLVFSSTQGELSDREIYRILQLKYQGISIYDFPSFYEDLTGKVLLRYIDYNWLLGKGELQGKISKFYIRIKRLYDIAFSAFLLIVTFPLCIFIAIAIKIDSKGKVLFPQERLGLRKNSFICYKFRTMKMDAEKEIGPIWSNKNDPRITRVGKMLRKTRLDELPQLWNIFKGDMSFVGNRPIRKYFADQLRKTIPFYDLRFSIKPGLTGWAQVNHGYSGSKEEQFEKSQFELFYIKKMSLFLDLFIIFKTIKTMFKRTGE
jgi:exopolysaccharide biosynthesis polyprenyl glycosylphosphotransferase